ncbi:MAG TPA: MFS transporter [Saprospirales bacterium]|nr:MFS transporter [Saprospirales bacterium]HAY70638.1 MFS transporter [Saprospirales bacterium]
MMNPAYKLMIIAWVLVAVWVVIVIFTNRKVHPKALFALFMVELWERFSYYGMRAILILYMTSELIRGGFGFDDTKAYGIYAAYGAMVYMTMLIGGYFADKVMGFRKAIIWGALLMAAAQFTLFLNNQTLFYIGLAFLVIGNGFFKPNISSMIGKFYPDGDPRRDGAFSLFYMGINIGAFLSPLTCGTIGEIEGWQYGFLTAGIGMLIGFLLFMWARSKGYFEDKGLPPENAIQFKMLGINGKYIPYIFTAVMIPLAWLLIVQNDVVDIILAVIAAGVIGYFLFIIAPSYEKAQKQRIWVIIMLLIFTTIFWTFFELAGSAMNLFTERNVNKNFMGAELTTTFFQSVNPLFIILFAPLFSWIWIKLAKSGKEPPAPYKFGFGLIMLGAGFLVLNLGKSGAMLGLVPAFFLIFLYLLHTLGELSLSPVGLSLVTKLSPPKIVGLLMGVWFLSSSIAHQAGKHIAKLTSIDEAKIVAEGTVQKNIADDVLKTTLKTDAFAESLVTNTLEKALVKDEFIDELNSRSGAENYYKARIQVSEIVEEANDIKSEKGKEKMLEGSYVEFLTRTPDFADPDKVKVLPKEEVDKMWNESLSGEVISNLRFDSLSLGLGVFRKLGLFAIACGAFLFLLGPLISRWMHGIK